MNYPIFIFHELVLRLQEIDHSIGRFDSTVIAENGVMVKTANGSLRVDLAILEKQYRNPKQIDQLALANLLRQYASAVPK